MSASVSSPALAGRTLKAALPPLLLVHLVRPVSLWLLAPGAVVASTIPKGFAQGTAYGDLLTAALALLALALVRTESRSAVVAVWVFNVVGFLDAFRNCIVGMHERAPEHMGAMVFVPAYGVPLIFVTHVLVAKVLLDRRRRPT